MANIESSENDQNITNEDKLNASLGYIAVFHPSEFLLNVDETNKTLVARIPVSPEQAENYLKGKKMHVSVSYKVDTDLAAKNADLFEQK